MNKNWKWLSALFVIIMCAMTLSSCSKGGSDDDDPFDPGSGGEEEVWDCVVCGGSGICENCDYYSDPSYCHGTGRCNNCDGTGWTQIGKHSGYECVYCDGSGICRSCDGKGICHNCDGTGKQP